MTELITKVKAGLSKANKGRWGTWASIRETMTISKSEGEEKEVPEAQRRLL